MHLVHLYLEHRTLKLNQTYTYLAPHHCVKGMRVRVPFGAQNLVGFVVKTEEFNADVDLGYELKEVIEVIDETAVLNDELLNLGLWMAEETLAPVVSCFQAMLPKLSNIRSSVKTIRLERWVIKTGQPNKLSPTQQAVWDVVSHESLYTPLKKRFGSPVDTLIKKGFLTTEEREIDYRSQLKDKQESYLSLSLDQVAALKAIRQADKAVCLFGTTGSGKTEIYLTLAEEALKAGHQALILVPEIGLTPQMVARVQARFGQDVIVYHSHLNDTERYLQYKRVRDGEKTVVVGTRSAIFLPFHDLSLIVLDEEHDNSYKQESHPRYHTKDIALKRAETFKAKVILGSATPSFETYARALKEVYTLVKLEARVKGELPKIQVVTPLRQQRQILAPETLKAIQTCLDLHQQVIILLNRRGYAPILQCLVCAKAIECPSCDRLLNVHKEDNLLKCHSCGYQTPLVHVCPHCQSTQLRMLGVGTQRLEEEIRQRFPTAKVLRLDSDSASKKNAHGQILEAFSNHEADILLGTQMIAKGLDIPSVTLSIILEIDQSLLRSDYRSVEEAFDLVVQTAGRSGRSDQMGKVIVQSRLEDHYVHQFAKKHDFDGFFRYEMNFRKVGQNPPYTYLISINASAPSQALAAQVLYTLMEALQSSTLTCLGPSDLGKVQNHYRARLILKGKDLNQMRMMLQEKLGQLSVHPSCELTVDVNPRSLF